jgi:iron complex outermembrane receptor protein
MPRRANCVTSPCTARTVALAIGAAIAAASTTGSASAADDVKEQAADAFGSRIGTESIGLYSESLVRGFDLQQAGNYRLGEAYFARAAAPPDTLVEGARIRVGPNALDIGFPAPSGIVQYRLLPGDRDRARVELGFQHLLDSNPRPYLRAHFAYRPQDGALSLAGGAIGSPSARYIFGNLARYQGIGLIPRLTLGEDWQATVFYGRYDQRYQADVGFLPATDRMPRPERLDYLGQAWSRFDTRNTTYGAILASHPRDGRWDYSLSAIHSRIRRPRSDLNIFSEVDADGRARARVSIARDRAVLSRAYEASAERDWAAGGRRDRLTLLTRLRRSDYTSPQVDSLALGEVSVFDPVPQAPEPVVAARPRARSSIDQEEFGAAWQRQWQHGAALNLGARLVALEEAAVSASGIASGRDSRAWLYNASLVVPVSAHATAFASYVRGIEEAGVAPQNATNAFEVLPPALARQSELGMKWQPTARFTLIGTLFEIAKPEPGFDRDRSYRLIGDVRHRGAELSMIATLAPGLDALVGGTWMRARLEGPAVEQDIVGERPVGRPERLALASLNYRPPAASAWSFDIDATYAGPRPADALNRTRTPGYTLVNAGLRYRFDQGPMPAALRLRVYNATDKYAWYADSGGMQAYEPARRVQLSVILGE